MGQIPMFVLPDAPQGVPAEGNALLSAIGRLVCAWGRVECDLDRKIIRLRTKGQKDTVAEFPLAFELHDIFYKLLEDGKSETFEMPAMPGNFPCLRQAVIIVRYASAKRSLPKSPGMPISAQRSLVPISSTSMPGTAAIADAFSIAVGDSSMTVIRLAAFKAVMSAGVIGLKSS